MKNIDRIKPDTFTYSSAISVCVEGKAWPLALELLEKMQTENVPANAVTFNSVIEALELMFLFFVRILTLSLKIFT